MSRRFSQKLCAVLLMFGLALVDGCSSSGLPTGTLREAVESPYQSGSNTYLAGDTSISACSNIDLGWHPSSQACYYWHRLKTSGSGACTQGRCDKLVIYFAGGDQACSLTDAPTNETVFYGKLAKQYTDHGYLFVCANLFTDVFTSDAALMPYTFESPRVAKLVNTILSSAEIQQHWSGRELLFSGISHGATASVLAMARMHVDRDAAWRGTHKTAACFLDGQYDIFYNQQFWMTPDHFWDCSWFHARNVCNRYLGLSSCLANTNAPWMDIDSIVAANPALPPSQAQRVWKSVTAADFEIKQWKLVECGSALSASGSSGKACDPIGFADMFPAPPIQALRDIFNAPGSGHHADFNARPSTTHFDCGLAGVADVECQPWFDSLSDTN